MESITPTIIYDTIYAKALAIYMRPTSEQNDSFVADETELNNFIQQQNWPIFKLYATLLKCAFSDCKFEWVPKHLAFDIPTTPQIPKNSCQPVQPLPTVSLTEEEKTVYTAQDKDTTEVCAICFDGGNLVYTKCMTVHKACYMDSSLQGKRRLNPEKCVLCNACHVSIPGAGIYNWHYNDLFLTKELALQSSDIPQQAFEDVYIEQEDDSDSEEIQEDGAQGYARGREQAYAELQIAFAELHRQQEYLITRQNEMDAQHFRVISEMRRLDHEIERGKIIEEMRECQKAVTCPISRPDRVMKDSVLALWNQREAVPFLPYEYYRLGALPPNALEQILPNNVPGPNGMSLRAYYTFVPLPSTSVSDYVGTQEVPTLGKRKRADDEDSDIEILYEEVLGKASKRFKKDKGGN